MNYASELSIKVIMLLRGGCCEARLVFDLFLLKRQLPARYKNAVHFGNFSANDMKHKKQYCHVLQTISRSHENDYKSYVM